MDKRLFFLVLCIIVSFQLIAQDTDINKYVQNQQKKLVYNTEKLVHIPNTQVKIMPPPHFELDTNINGFVHSGSASTIQIIEVPEVSYISIDKSMTPEHIKSQNYTLIERKEVILETGSNAVIYFVSFNADGVDFERAMLFTGEENTIWVNFNYPVSMKKLLYPAIESSLLSVQAL